MLKDEWHCIGGWSLFEVDGSLILSRGLLEGLSPRPDQVSSRSRARSHFRLWKINFENCTYYVAVSGYSMTPSHSHVFLNKTNVIYWSIHNEIASRKAASMCNYPYCINMSHVYNKTYSNAK